MCVKQDVPDTGLIGGEVAKPDVGETRPASARSAVARPPTDNPASETRPASARPASARRQWPQAPPGSALHALEAAELSSLTVQQATAKEEEQEEGKRLMLKARYGEQGVGKGEPAICDPWHCTDAIVICIVDTLVLFVEGQAPM